MAFCQNCGKELSPYAKFCTNCGAALGVDLSDNMNTQLKYDGTIHKCPNCGELLNSFNIYCPTCGYELRGVDATNSVREFAKKIESINSIRKPHTKNSALSKLFHIDTNDSVDDQMISLIRTYSIPNTKEDILEFMILASTNIDKRVYKGAFISEFSGIHNLNYDIQRSRSEAWYAKFEQAYQKAQLSFGDSPDFHKIEQLYKKTRRKISLAKSKGIILTFFIFCAPFLLLLLLTLL